MRVSIITSVFNAKDTISDTIESVLSQTHDDIEYIIVDAASTDGSIDIIKAYEDKITIFISEFDNGIYEGHNKGIALATGEIIGFLNSDDLFENEYTIEKIVNRFNSCNCDSVYGDLVYVKRDEIDYIIRYWKSREYNVSKLQRGWMPPHPTFYVKREIYEKFGSFNTDFKIAADYDLMIRFLSKAKITTSYIPEVLVRMKIGGKSNKSIKNIIQKSIEDLKAIHLNQVGDIYTLFLKNISKIPQFFIKTS